jgi:predicted metalloenzyme YecM
MPWPSTHESWPRAAWESIKILNGGDSAHHIKKKVMALKLPNGKLAENDGENASVMHPHFNKVYNNKSQPDLLYLYST